MAGVESQAIRRHAELGELDLLQKYVEADASLVHAEGSKRHTPLHLGVRNGHVAVCSFLMEHGANIEAQDMQHNTPLLVAVLHNHLPLLRMLIAKRANVNAANKNKESALHLAAQRCYLPVVESLLRAGAYPLCKDKDGKMPIDVVGTKVLEEEEGEGSAQDITAALQASMSVWRTGPTGAGDDVMSPNGSMHITEATLNDAKATAQASRLETSVLSLTSQLAALRWHDAKTQVSLSTCRHKVKETEEQLTQAQHQCTSLSSELATLQATHASVCASLESHKSESAASVKALTQERDASLSHAKDLQAQLDTAIAHTQSLKASISDLEGRLAASEKDKEAVKAVSQDTSTKLASAKQQIEALEAQVKTLTHKADTLQAQLSEKEKLVSSNEEKTAALTKTHTQAMSQAVDKLKHLTSELSNTKSSLAASQKDNETLRAQVVELEMGVRGAQANGSEAVKAKDHELAQLQSKVSQLSAQLSAESQAKAALQKTLDDKAKAPDAHHAQLEALTKQLAESQAVVSKLEKQVAKDKVDLDTEETVLTNFTKALEAQLNEERSFRDMVTERNAELEAMLKRMQADATQRQHTSSPFMPRTK